MSPEFVPGDRTAEKILFPEVKNLVLLSKPPRVNDFINFFVLKSLEIISPDVKISRGNTLINWSKSSDTINIQNPNDLKTQMLYKGLKSAQMTYLTKKRLRELVHYSEIYHGAGNSWTEVREKLIQQKADPFIHDAIASILSATFDLDVQTQFENVTDFLGRILNIESTDFMKSIKFSTSTPIFKNKGDEEWTDRTSMDFDAENILRLGSTKTIVIGGSPNSGKSTFTASLFLAMQKIVRRCDNVGITEPGRFVVNYCDMDTSSPTVKLILDGNVSQKEKGTPWDSKKVEDAIFEYHMARISSDIVIVDLPGGIPDDITRALTEELSANSLAIHIDKHTHLERPEWTTFMTTPGMPDYSVAIHTRYDEHGKSSGVRYFDSYTRGDRRNFIQARLCDLKREPVVDDQTIDFIAHMLLFDFLPNLNDPEEELRFQVRESLKSKRKKS